MAEGSAATNGASEFFLQRASIVSRPRRWLADGSGSCPEAEIWRVKKRQSKLKAEMPLMEGVRSRPISKPTAYAVGSIISHPASLAIEMSDGGNHVAATDRYPLFIHLAALLAVFKAPYKLNQASHADS
jgi:hypothetical protein